MKSRCLELNIHSHHWKDDTASSQCRYGQTMFTKVFGTRTFEIFQVIGVIHHACGVSVFVIYTHFHAN